MSRPPSHRSLVDEDDDKLQADFEFWLTQHPEYDNPYAPASARHTRSVSAPSKVANHGARAALAWLRFWQTTIHDHRRHEDMDEAHLKSLYWQALDQYVGIPNKPQRRRPSPEPVSRMSRGSNAKDFNRMFDDVQNSTTSNPPHGEAIIQHQRNLTRKQSTRNTKRRTDAETSINSSPNAPLTVKGATLNTEFSTTPNDIVTDAKKAAFTRRMERAKKQGAVAQSEESKRMLLAQTRLSPIKQISTLQTKNNSFSPKATVDHAAEKKPSKLEQPKPIHSSIYDANQQRPHVVQTTVTPGTNMKRHLNTENAEQASSSLPTRNVPIRTNLVSPQDIQRTSFNQNVPSVATTAKIRAQAKYRPQSETFIESTTRNKFVRATLNKSRKNDISESSATEQAKMPLHIKISPNSTFNQSPALEVDILKKSRQAQRNYKILEESGLLNVARKHLQRKAVPTPIICIPKSFDSRDRALSDHTSTRALPDLSTTRESRDIESETKSDIKIDFFQVSLPDQSAKKKSVPNYSIQQSNVVQREKSPERGFLRPETLTVSPPQVTRLALASSSAPLPFKHLSFRNASPAVKVPILAAVLRDEDDAKTVQSTKSNGSMSILSHYADPDLLTIETDGSSTMASSWSQKRLLGHEQQKLQTRHNRSDSQKHAGETWKPLSSPLQAFPPPVPGVTKSISPMPNSIYARMKGPGNPIDGGEVFKRRYNKQTNKSTTSIYMPVWKKRLRGTDGNLSPVSETVRTYGISLKDDLDDDCSPTDVIEVGLLCSQEKMCESKTSYRGSTTKNISRVVPSSSETYSSHDAKHAQDLPGNNSVHSATASSVVAHRGGLTHLNKQNPFGEVSATPASDDAHRGGLQVDQLDDTLDLSDVANRGFLHVSDSEEVSCSVSNDEYEDKFETEGPLLNYASPFGSDVIYETFQKRKIDSGGISKDIFKEASFLAQREKKEPPLKIGAHNKKSLKTPVENVGGRSTSFSFPQKSPLQAAITNKVMYYPENEKHYDTAANFKPGQINRPLSASQMNLENSSPLQARKLENDFDKGNDENHTRDVKMRNTLQNPRTRGLALKQTIEEQKLETSAASPRPKTSYQIAARHLVPVREPSKMMPKPAEAKKTVKPFGRVSDENWLARHRSSKIFEKKVYTHEKNLSEIRQFGSFIHDAIDEDSMFDFSMTSTISSGLTSYKTQGGNSTKDVAHSIVQGMIALSVAACVIQSAARRMFARNEAIGRMIAIFIIQAYWRKGIHRRRYIKMRSSADKIRRCFLMWGAKYWLDINRFCATEVQRVFRGYLANKLVDSQIFSVVRIQASARRWIVQSRVRKTLDEVCLTLGIQRSTVERSLGQCPMTALRKILALVTIQAYVRRFLAQNKCASLNIQVTRVQCLFRGWWVRVWLGINAFCASEIQRVIRGFNARKHVENKRKDRFVSSIVKLQANIRRRRAMEVAVVRFFSIIDIQAVCRGHLERMRLPQTKALVYISATKIQCLFRQIAALKAAYSRFISAIRIQSASRVFLAKRMASKSVANAVIIQKHWRGHAARRCYDFFLYDLITIQAYVRRFLSQLCLNRLVSEKQDVATAGGHTQMTSEEEFLNFAATVVQAEWRRHKCRIDYFYNLAVSILIQSVVRGWLTRNAVRKYKAMLRTFVLTPGNSTRGSNHAQRYAQRKSRLQGSNLEEMASRVPKFLRRAQQGSTALPQSWPTNQGDHVYSTPPRRKARTLGFGYFKGS